MHTLKQAAAVTQERDSKFLLPPLETFEIQPYDVDGGAYRSKAPESRDEDQQGSDEFWMNFFDDAYFEQPCRN